MSAFEGALPQELATLIVSHTLRLHLDKGQLNSDTNPNRMLESILWWMRYEVQPQCSLFPPENKGEK